MLAKPIPKGKIGKLAEAALSRDFDTMRTALQTAVTSLSKVIAADFEIAESDKEAALRDATANYINKAESALDGQTVLHLTANFPTVNDGDLGAMIFLLKHGANPNAQDANGNTLLHHYASKCLETAVAFVESYAKTQQASEARIAFDTIEQHMIRLCMLACYLGNPTLTNNEGKSAASIMEEFDQYIGTETGLQVQLATCYLNAVKGATPPGKVNVSIPQNLMQAKQPEGHHASKVTAGRAANENQKNNAGCCVLL
jgi:hypothetical protein